MLIIKTKDKETKGHTTVYLGHINKKQTHTDKQTHTAK